MTGRLAADWPRLARRLAHARRLALLTDFDGTLAPIQPHPDFVSLPQPVRRTLGRLAALGHVVGVVSGRRIDDLRRRVAVPGLWYAGNHGYFLQSPGGVQASLVRPDQHVEVERIARELARRLRRVRGIRLERKPASVAVHYRGAPASSHRVVARTVQRIARREGDLRLLAGKCVWELLPHTPVDKSVAVRAILNIERQRRPGEDLPAVFIGDDVTDEVVFGLRLTLPVAVGRRRTKARYRVRTPADVARLLDRILALVERRRR
jgi:trehalose-phosphatase